MSELYIAEKKDIADAIASYIWPDGQFEKRLSGKGNGYYRQGDTFVSWAKGHVLALVNPDAYGQKFLKWDEYRCFPQQWLLYSPADKKDQFNILRELLKTKYDTLYHCGDADREGQLLIDEILQYCGYKGTVKRILINSKDNTGLKRAFDSIEDNRNYQNLLLAGLAREQWDWLIGFNLTRCATVCARRFGYRNTWNIGGVKTPTLALVVNREREIQNFKKTNYFTLKAFFRKDNISFNAMWQPGDSVPQDPEGRVLDRSIADMIRKKVENHDGIVVTVEKKKGTSKPPLPYSLAALQVDAGKLCKLSLTRTLDITEKLYMDKLVSYPRSDCKYLPEAQLADASGILDKLTAIGIKGAAGANPDLKSPAWNDNKISAHHAIIPTGVAPKDLKEDEAAVYRLICERYVLQFYPDCQYETTKFSLNISDETFTGSGKIILFPGYTSLLRKDVTEDIENNENIRLPNLSQGENLGVPQNVDLQAKETKPPKRFTEVSLLDAMINIYRFMDKDNPYRKKMMEVKEGASADSKGIGTPATRNVIIVSLYDNPKNRKLPTFCSLNKKGEIVPTDIGFSLIDNVPAELGQPDTRAMMEMELDSIEAGEGSYPKFLDEAKEMVLKNIAFFENHKFTEPVMKHFKCPVCKNGELLLRYSPATKNKFFVCENENCIHPDSGRKVYYNCTAEEEPVIEFCPDDQSVLIRINGKNGFFWSCPKCRKTFNDINGRPDLSGKKKSMKGGKK